MKKFTTLALIAFASAGAWANADLAKKNNCLACHAADKKIVGPAYQDVAKKYAGQVDAEATVAKNIKAGGSGKSFLLSMPAGFGVTANGPGHSWHYFGASEPSIQGRKMLLPRGKGLGGSSNINGLLYVRGQQADYDSWSNLGAIGWG